MHAGTLILLLIIAGSVLAIYAVHRSGGEYGPVAGCHGGHGDGKSTTRMDAEAFRGEHDDGQAAWLSGDPKTRESAQ